MKTFEQVLERIRALEAEHQALADKVTALAEERNSGVTPRLKEAAHRLALVGAEMRALGWVVGDDA